MKSPVELLLLVCLLFALLISSSCACNDGDNDSGDDDDDNDNDNDDDDDNDDTAAPRDDLRIPSDVDEDGEPELVIAHRWDDLTETWVRYELYDPETMTIKSQSGHFRADSSQDADLGDYDGDGYAEILSYVRYYDGVGDPVTEYRLLDGPALSDAFSRSFGTSGYLGPQVDFNGDGVADPAINPIDNTDFSDRLVVFNGTNGYSPLWDTGSSAGVRYELEGIWGHRNYQIPANFGTLGSGWLVVKEDSPAHYLYTLLLIGPTGTELASLGPQDLEWGYLYAAVEDLDGDGQDEIVEYAKYTPSKGSKADPWDRIRVLEVPGFAELYTTGQVENVNLSFNHLYDVDANGTNDLVIISRDMIDDTTTVRALDGMNGYVPLFSYTTEPNFVFYWLNGDRTAPDRATPAKFEGIGERFVTVISDPGASDADIYLGLLDPGSGDIDPITTSIDIAFGLPTIGDYDGDGFDEIFYCTWWLIDPGGDPYLESACEIFDGPDLETVWSGGPYHNAGPEPVGSFDLDADGVPDPAVSTFPLDQDADCFFLVLDGLDDYSEKARIDCAAGGSLEPLLMYP
jgi:hypothetical protein